MIILVVEDEAIIAQALAIDLCAGGHQVLGPAASIEEALQLVDEELPPELALLDIDLRCAGDGIILARILRARHAMPSLFLSAQTRQARVNKDAAWGVIGKPYETRAVLDAVNVMGELRSGLVPSNVPAELELF